jgi:hypothetical protein
MREQSERHLVGYRVRLKVEYEPGYVYGCPGGLGGSTHEPERARLFLKRSEAYADLEASNRHWGERAKVVAVYRRLVRRAVPQ